MFAASASSAIRRLSPAEPSLLVFPTRFPHLLVKLHPFVCWFPPPLFHPSKMKAREMGQGKLLSSRAPVDSSSSKTAMVPCDDPAPASSQLGVMLNCQLFTQAITEAVILCKYSRQKGVGTAKKTKCLLTCCFCGPCSCLTTVLAQDHCFSDCLSEQLTIQHNIEL